MGDEELIARLREASRKRDEFEAVMLATNAADRIYNLGLLHDMAEAKVEALTAEVARVNSDKRFIMGERDRTFALMLARAEKAEAERDAAVEALVEHNDLLRSTFQIAEREGVKGMIASTNWDAFYNRVAVVLKRYHETANKARATLSKIKEGKL